MNSQQLLYLNIFFGTAIVLYFIFGRSKPKQPVRLKMKDDASLTESREAEPKLEAAIIPFVQKPPEVTADSKPEAKPKVVSEVIPIQSGSLKIRFAFNGHDWEAYEALGVPVNAPLSTVTRMYQHLIKTSDASTFDFYESAYQAIMKRRRDRS